MTFLRKRILVSGGQILGLLPNLLATILFARPLGPRAMGQVEVFRSAGTIAGTVLVLGTGNNSVYFLHNLKVATGRMVTSTLNASLPLGLCLSAGMATAILVCRGYFGRVSILTAAWFAIGSACLLGMYTLGWMLGAQISARLLVFVDLTPRIIMLSVGGLMAVLSVCNILLAGDGRAMITACSLAGTLCLTGAVTRLAVPPLGTRGTTLAVLCGSSFTAAARLAMCEELYGLRPHRCLLVTGGDLRYVANALLRLNRARPAQEAPGHG